MLFKLWICISNKLSIRHSYQNSTSYHRSNNLQIIHLKHHAVISKGVNQSIPWNTYNFSKNKWRVIILCDWIKRGISFMWLYLRHLHLTCLFVDDKFIWVPLFVKYRLYLRLAMATPQPGMDIAGTFCEWCSALISPDKL